MNNNVELIESKQDDYISVTLYIENDEIMEIGEKINIICEDAYMSGENWAALIDFYLERNAPELAEDMESDPEAGVYSAYYSWSEANMRKAENLAELFIELTENPDLLYEFVEEYASEIEWD